jgi:hypothetical protein
MCKNFAKVDCTDCEITIFEMERAKFLNYSILRFCTISMHIMLGTCVPNLRGRGWVEHTQMHLALKKGTKTFHYTSNSWGNFCEFTFSSDKNSKSWYEGPGVLYFFSKNKIWKKKKSPSSKRIGRFHTLKYRGKVQKMGVMCTHFLRMLGPSPTLVRTPKREFKKIKKLKKKEATGGVARIVSDYGPRPLLLWCP